MLRNTGRVSVIISFCWGSKVETILEVSFFSTSLVKKDAEGDAIVVSVVRKSWYVFYGCFANSGGNNSFREALYEGCGMTGTQSTKHR